jgi:hypothetical protein
VSDAANDLRVLEAQIALTSTTATEISGRRQCRESRYLEGLGTTYMCQKMMGHTGEHAF